MSDTDGEHHDEDITNTRHDDTTMTAGSGNDDNTFGTAEDFVVNGEEANREDFTFGTAEDFVVNDEEANEDENTGRVMGVRDDTRMSGIAIETDAIDDTELLIGTTPSTATRGTPLGTPIRKTPARARLAGRTPGSRSARGAVSRNRTPMHMTPRRVLASPRRGIPLRSTPGMSGDGTRVPLSTPRVLGTRVGEVTPGSAGRGDNENIQDAIGGAAKFLEEYNLRHYKAGNPFVGLDDTLGEDDHADDGDLTFSHVTFWGKDVPDKEELEALEEAKELNDASARLIQRLVCTNAIQRRFIRQQNEGWADLADAEREEDHRRVSSVQKIQAEAIQKLNKERVKLMEELALEKDRNAELTSEIQGREEAILNFKTSICQNEEVDASDIDAQEALALLDEQSKGLRLASERLGDLKEHNDLLMVHQQAIVDVASKIRRSNDVEEAIATLSDFIEKARDVVNDADEKDQRGQIVADEDIEGIYALAQSVGYNAGELASLPDAVEVLWTFVDEAKETKSRKSPKARSSPYREGEGSPSAIDDVSKQSLQHELNVRTAELDTFAAYAKELDPEMDPVASAKDILELFKTRIGRVSIEKVIELENEVKEYEELYAAQIVRVNSLEDGFEKAQTRMSSLEKVLSQERERHDSAIKEMENNTENAVADLERHTKLLADRNLELVSLQEEYAMLKKLNEEDGDGPDNATLVQLELTNKKLTDKCSEFERNMCFWKERAHGVGQVVNHSQRHFNDTMTEESASDERHSIGTGGYSALAKRIEMLSDERSSLVEKLKHLKDELQSKEYTITEMRKEFALERDTLQKLLDHANVELEDLREEMNDAPNAQLRDTQDALSDDDTIDEQTTRFSLKITDIINATSWDDKSIEAAIHSLDELVGVKDNFVDRTSKLVAQLKSLGKSEDRAGKKERALLTIDSRTTLEKFAVVFKMQQNLIKLLRGRTWSSIRRLSKAAAASGDPTLTSDMEWTLPPTGLSPLKSPVVDKDHTMPYSSGRKHAMRAQRTARPARRSSIDRASSANKTFEYMKTQLDETRNLLQVQDKETKGLREMVAKTEAENLHLQEVRVDLRSKMDNLRTSTDKFLKRIASVAFVDPTQNAIERFCITAVSEKEAHERAVCLQSSLERKASSLLVQKAVLLQTIDVFHNTYGVSIFGKQKARSFKSVARSIIWVNRLSRFSATSSHTDDQNLLVAASSLYDIPNSNNITQTLSVNADMGDLLVAYSRLPQLEQKLHAREAKIRDMANALTLLENTSPLEHRGPSPVKNSCEDYNRDIMKRKNELAALLEQKIDDLSQKYSDEYKLRIASEANIAAYIRKISSLKKKMDKLKIRYGKREVTYKAAIKFLKEKADAASSNPADETVVYAFNEEMEKLKQKNEYEKVVVYNEGEKENDEQAVKLLEEQISQLREEAQSISADPWLKEQNREYVNGMARAVRKIKRFADKHESREKGVSESPQARELSASP